MTACKAVEIMKTKVKETIDPIPAVYQQQLVEVSASQNLDQVAAKLATLYSMKSSLYRIRRNRLPPLPMSRGEVHFEEEWSITHAGERFLMTEDGEGNDKIKIYFQLLLT